MTRPAAVAVLPMAVQVGDRFLDEAGEWEVAGGPSTVREGHAVHVRVERPGDPGTAKDVTWPAHERVTIIRRRPDRPARAARRRAPRP